MLQNKGLEKLENEGGPLKSLKIVGKCLAWCIN